MAHIEQAEHLRRDLVAYRDRIQALVDHLDQGLPDLPQGIRTIQGIFPPGQHRRKQLPDLYEKRIARLASPQWISCALSAWPD